MSKNLRDATENSAWFIDFNTGLSEFGSIGIGQEYLFRCVQEETKNGKK